jgi:hypothetical protein
MRHADASKGQQAAHSGGNEHVPTTDGFDELMPKTLATATVDRLLHHAHPLPTNGTQSCS